MGSSSPDPTLLVWAAAAGIMGLMIWLAIVMV